MSDDYRTYTGNDIDVEFSLKRCIHAGECVKGAPGVFNPEARPWIQVDNEDTDQIAEVVRRCPSGALRFIRKDGAEEQPDPEPTVTMTPGGPLYLRGDVLLKLRDGEERVTRVALCRCGASANKPFCDGAHEQAGFDDAGDCEEIDVEPEAPGQSVTVKFNTHGAIKLEGRATVKNVKGEAILRRDVCMLCRCGMSGNKPMCDASHMREGWKEDS
jgi:uncharacterized Fe-S cluster protein YjdI/CDGSH-type Zn-finger protein